ncbi:hypothetical protein [Oerskovia sp. Root22]|uniref:hypothetical protein n=1 Tax=Oerskovia sp. Root22 TaxID=1736494 RepID=UPI0007021880|nr:hypothetical protein [Oerskovia sp. Root22]KRC37752.1 hypothetical protein ASE15_06895 [Oerskovia sp. Root22]
MDPARPGPAGPAYPGPPSGSVPATPGSAAAAWQSAQAWHAYARTQAGPAQQHALAASAHWFAVHRTLAAQESARAGWAAHPTPPAVAPTGLAPAPGPSSAAGPAWGTAGHHGPPAPAAPPGYPAPGAPQPPRRRGPALVGTFVAIVGVLVLIGMVLGVVRSAQQGLAEVFDNPAPTVPAIDGWVAPEPVPEPATDQVPATGDVDPAPGDLTADGTDLPPGAGMEERWKQGEYALPVPDDLLTASPGTPFAPGQPDPTRWLVDLNAANEGLRVVFTDDSTYNCGMDWIVERDMRESGVAGCYDPDYPTTLFMYWGPEASAAAKEFVLAHELSHLMQWWHRFDVVQSAGDAGLRDDEDWKTVVESDATCRVLSWGGYSQEVADSSSSPCTAPDWSEDWLAEQAAARGVTITDY